jgi:hypothetical protein
MGSIFGNICDHLITVEMQNAFIDLYVAYWRKTTMLALALFCFILSCFSQGSEPYGKGLRLDLDSSGHRYLRLIVWNQIWMRSMQLNPGSIVNGQPVNNVWDIGARRLRLIGYAQITPRYLILFHIGINNQTFATGGAPGTGGTGPNGSGKKPQLFFHDAWNEYAVIPAVNPVTGQKNKYSLYFGAGLHYWNGISRMSSASTLNFLTLDAPMVNWPLVETSDQFVRQFGLYIKGRLGQLNYRMHLNKPFATNTTPPDPDPVRGPVAVDNNGNSNLALGGYFDYQFFDQEENLLPYRVGTYLGTRKIFNIGAGFYHNSNGTLSKTITNNQDVFTKHDITLLGADVFADLPVGNPVRNMAFTGYSVFYKYDFGPNYLRTIGIMNPSSGFAQGMPSKEMSLNGPGNARMFVGTGNIWYTQAGLLLPNKTQDKVKLQPYAAYTFQRLQALDEVGHYFDIGCNIFLDGHHAKFTTQYSSRPLYYDINGKRNVTVYKGEILLQFQVYL